MKECYEIKINHSIRLDDNQVFLTFSCHFMANSLGDNEKFQGQFEEIQGQMATVKNEEDQVRKS